MKRTIVMMLLIVTAGSVNAGWIGVMEMSFGKFYIDPLTVGRDPSTEYRKVWTLQDFKSPVNGARSMKAHQEFDCPNERTRVLSLVIHRDPMGEGEVIARENPQGAAAGWIPVPPNTSAAFTARFVCSLPELPAQK